MNPKRTPFRVLLAYATGEGATSLTMNGIAGFAMLYYTQVLGLGAGYAGLALSITLIWDAVSDPIMGHITDNTRSRWGRRHPYILVGGVLLAISFLFLWFVPTAFAGPARLFWYLLVMNLLVRTAVTIFVVPYSALGFEICTDYDERSKLQSVRFFFNMVANFLGIAMAWSIFFRDRTGPDGARIDGTRIAENYAHMGTTLTVATFFLICICVYSTRGFARDNRATIVPHNDLRSFLRDFRSVISDRYARYVFGFFGIASLGTMLVAQVQMFTYVDFMNFTHVHKTVAHGAGMIAFALGSLLQAPLVVRLDKKQTGYIGVGVSIFGNLMLLLLFIGELLPPETFWKVPASVPVAGGVAVPVSVLAFALFQGMWWGGIGMLLPLTISMMADISGIHHLQTGVLKDGSYAAMFSFVMKAAAGVGMFINGWALDLAGFVSTAEVQSPGAIRNVAILTFTAGPVVMLVAFPLLWKYPIDRAFMARVKDGGEIPGSVAQS